MTNNRNLDQSYPIPDRITYLECPRCHDRNPAGWICYGCLAKGHKPQPIDQSSAALAEISVIFTAIVIICLSALAWSCS